jgi:hypothetical protein
MENFETLEELGFKTDWTKAKRNIKFTLASPLWVNGIPLKVGVLKKIGEDSLLVKMQGHQEVLEIKIQDIGMFKQQS